MNKHQPVKVRKEQLGQWFTVNQINNDNVHNELKY